MVPPVRRRPSFEFDTFIAFYTSRGQRQNPIADVEKPQVTCRRSQIQGFSIAGRRSRWSRPRGCTASPETHAPAPRSESACTCQRRCPCFARFPRRCNRNCRHALRALPGLVLCNKCQECHRFHRLRHRSQSARLSISRMPLPWLYLAKTGSFLQPEIPVR